MASIYGLSCVTGGGGNTGTPKCAIDVKAIAGDILIPHGKTFTHAELADFITTLSGLAKNDSKYLRIYPLFGYVQAEIGGDDRTTKQWNYGVTSTIRRGTINHTYTFEGLRCLHRSVMNFDGKFGMFDILRVDQDGVIHGVEKTVNDEKVMGGFSLSDLYVGDYKEATGDDTAQWTILHQFANSDEWNKKWVAVKPETGDALTDLQGLWNLDLEYIPVTPAVSGVYNILATESCGGNNILDIYPTELLDPDLWTATNIVTGGDIAITTVAVNGKYLKFTLDTTDPDFVGGNRIRIAGVAPSVLDAAGIVNYEIGSVIVPNP